MRKGLALKLLRRASKEQALVVNLANRRKEVGFNRTSLSFREYIQLVKPDFIFYQWNEIAIARLQEVADGKLFRLLIQVPPRHGKSELCKLFAGYYLTRFPKRYTGVCGYGQELTYPFSRDARHYFKQGGGRLNQDAQSVTFWETVERGGCWAASVGGSVTGKGASVAILDDAIKDRQQSESPAEIRTLHGWYKSTFRTRINPESGAIVIVQTRWSEVDAIGLVMDLEAHADEESREGWHIIDFPARFQDWRLRPAIPDCITVEEDFRKENGQPLCPERYDDKALRIIENTLGSREWNCLYQQNPIALDDAIFKPTWWRYRSLAQIGELPRRRVVLSIDCTFKDAENSDYVAMVALCEHEDGTVTILDVINERLDIIGTMSAIRNWANRFSPAAVLVEEAANGYAVIQMMKAKLPNIIGVKTGNASKVSRASGAAPMIEAGSVYLPPNASWLHPFINQFSTFPRSKHDDMVDACTQALNWLRDRRAPQVTVASWGQAG